MSHVYPSGQVVISTTTFHTGIMNMPHTHTEGVPHGRGTASQEGIRDGMQEGHRITRTRDNPGHLADSQTLNSVALREQRTAGS